MKFIVCVKLHSDEIRAGYACDAIGVSRTRRYRTLKQALAFARRIHRSHTLVWIEHA